MFNISDTVEKLCMSYGVSGDEKKAEETALEILKKYIPDAEIINGNVIGTLNKEKTEGHILLDAHIDEVGFIVTDITDDGFLKIDSVGGLDPRIMPAQRVIVHGTKDIEGTVCSVPPHLAGSDKKVTPISDSLIDTGYTTEELKKIVSRGDMVSYKSNYTKLQGNNVTATTLDDRCGVCAIIYALDILNEYGFEKIPYKLSVMFSSKEETGEQGAACGAYTVNPDVAIEVDVTFAKAHDEEGAGAKGENRKGALIGISPSLSREISNKLIETAEKYNIDYDTEIMSGMTSTNADRFSISRGGAKTCTVSPPIKYMHTPIETMSLDDIEKTGRLLAEFVRNYSFGD